jgi:hypothetical protein
MWQGAFLLRERAACARGCMSQPLRLALRLLRLP